ncbi:MAG: hypothetical protein AB1656_09695 [Candidatus Omnitrophota bacterium]
MYLSIPSSRRMAFLSLLIFWGSVSAQELEKTCFQTADRWSPLLDLRSDVAIVYGVNSSFPDRIRSWRERGYGIHLMTGVAWGGYQDYLNGKFDGKNHLDEGQVQRNGEMIMHGPGVPYMVPTKSYIEYLQSLVKTAIDEGVTAIHLEEPEFWNRGGYSEGFKREWQEYYGEPWQAQHESPEATYRSAKLKYHLYFRALKDIFLYAKDYSGKKGTRVRCYVPTHTLINYSAWNIVSPESSLSDLPGMDGYIGQVWTGTARSPIIYRGVQKERTFENAFLEYASMVAMTAPTGRRVYFLTDPIEDNPNHTWEDYRRNYEATFTAQLLQPSIADYEVMPWPSRIFNGRYSVEGSGEKKGIPADYASEILVLINALNEMEPSSDPLPGTQGVGVLLSDTMMFQRFPTHENYQDPALSNFYGMALPLLKLGVPVRLVQMENLLQPDVLKGIRVLAMSYANMKPLKPEYHEVLVQWVKQGGALIYLGRDDDPFQKIREWWNQDGRKFKAPSEHLLGLLNFKPENNDKGPQPCGDGIAAVVRRDPKELVMNQEAFDLLPALVSDCLKKSAAKNKDANSWQPKNYFHLQRGAYDIAAAMNESVSDQPYVIKGPVVDLFDSQLPLLKEKAVAPDQRVFLLNLARVKKPAPCILAASSRAYEEKREKGYYSFTMKGPASTNGIARLLLPVEHKSLSAKGPDGQAIDLQPQWDAGTRTLLIRYPNQPDGVDIEIEY